MPQKRVVWQDVVPAKSLSKQPSIKLTRRQKNKIYLLKLSKYIFYKKNTIRTSRKQSIYIILSLIIVIIAATAYFFIKNHQSVKISSTTNNEVQETKINKQDVGVGTPDFSTIVPNGKNIKDLGGWTRISPPDTDPVFAYVDKINNIPINVSQQPLPDDFKTDTENKLEQLSKGFSATEKIIIGKLNVHIGTSAKGPQSVIFSIDNLLILIKSNDQINNDSWIKYINSMQ
jgi:hypothetical protein